MKHIILFTMLSVMLLVALSLSSCISTKPATGRHQGLSALDDDKNSVSGDSAASETADIPNFMAGEVDYESYIPDIEFGLRLFAFENDDYSGKTILYSEVTYNDMEDYAEQLSDGGYVCIELDCNREEDKYRAVFYNKDNNMNVSIRYAESGLTVMVYSAED
ncbi:MAG: hypothetical protein IJO93_05535 [Clostridia bacterium]|nr:hypothetical protein [Clostridia bacterium]